jgi:hypothetical protein
VVGRKQEKTLSFLGLPLWDSLPDSMKKSETRVQSSPFIEGISEVDAKSCFSFFHCVSVGVPKIFAVFSCFLYELSVLIVF